jgi:hypothetical protein
MDSIKTYFIVWISGVFVGVVLLERWQRTSGLRVPAAENPGEAVETEAASTPEGVSADHPKVSAVIVAGAKADAQRARQLVERVLPWGRTSAPSLAQMRQAGRATASDDAPSPPA